MTLPPHVFIGAPGHPMTWFGAPPDAVAWAALLLALLVLAPTRLRLACSSLPTRPTVMLLACASALLSLGYFFYYLGGEPRIIDASTYLLEARTLATGSFSFAVPEPTALFRGRFLLPVATAPGRLAPIFPPGYPALLALGTLAYDYRIIGPLLAASLTAATAWLAWEVTGERRVVKLAALLATLSAALRYHTADTMSHGLSIVLLCVAATLSTVLHRQVTPDRELTPEASPGRSRRSTLALGLGLTLGWLFATRPLTALLGGAGLLLPLLLRGRVSSRSLALIALGVAPGVVLLLLQQWAVTGSPWQSLQLRYYALADGPENCFGLGLGKGCRHEHGDVVRTQGGDGLTWLWAVKNLFFRIHWHSLDVANAEPLWLLGMLSFFRQPKGSALRRLLWPIVLVPLGYAGFYFQGSYPGGGARFLSELIPLLLVAISTIAVELHLVRSVLALGLFGFAVHGAFLHRHLPRAPQADAPGEHPDGVPRVTTDFAFNVLYDPRETKRGGLPSVARSTRDSRTLDRKRGHPGPLTFEGESDWPVLDQSGVWSYPIDRPEDCLSHGRGLLVGRFLQDENSPPIRLTLELTGVPAGDYSLTAHFFEPGRGCVEIALGIAHLPTHEILTEVELGPLIADGTTVLDRVTAIPATNLRAPEKKR